VDYLNRWRYLGGNFWGVFSLYPGELIGSCILGMPINGVVNEARIIIERRLGDD